MELDQGAFILALLSLFLHLIDKLWSIKPHPANYEPSTYKPEVSSESEAQNRKIAEMNDRLFNK